MDVWNWNKNIKNHTRVNLLLLSAKNCKNWFGVNVDKSAIYWKKINLNGSAFKCDCFFVTAHQWMRKVAVQFKKYGCLFLKRVPSDTWNMRFQNNKPTHQFLSYSTQTQTHWSPANLLFTNPFNEQIKYRNHNFINLIVIYFHMFPQKNLFI